MKICLFRQSWTKGFREIHEIKQNRFFYECFTADSMRFFTLKRQNLALPWTAGYLPYDPII